MRCEGGRRLAMTEADRRQQIVAAASDVFAEKGYHAATMDEVSRRAGMSKKTIYQLFQSKSAIFQTLVERWACPFQMQIEGGSRSQREVLSTALHHLIGHVLDEAQIAISRVLIAEAARPGEVADALEALGIDRDYSALEQWLASQPTLGRYTVHDPVELAAMIFFAAAGDVLLNLLLRIRPARPKPKSPRASSEWSPNISTNPPELGYITQDKVGESSPTP